MARYQVTVTYKIIIDGATNKNNAECIAIYDIGTNPFGYNNVEIEEIHIPKCCGLRAQTCVIDDVIGPSDLYEDRMHLSGIKDYIGTLRSFKNYLEEHKVQQEKVLNALKERLGEIEIERKEEN